MKYKLYLKNRQEKEIILDSAQYSKIQDVILQQLDEKVAVDGGRVFNARDVVSVTPYSDNTEAIKKNTHNRNQAKLDFLRDEDEYRRETPVDKAKREYYTRFLGMVTGAYGMKAVLGDDYVSPLHDTERTWHNQDPWMFSEQERADRKRRFDEWVGRSEHAELWGKDLKNFFVEFFEKNPSKSWCDLGDWVPIFIEGKLPTSRFDKILVNHDHQVRGTDGTNSLRE